jgi:proton glutamate symport protein
MSGLTWYRRLHWQIAVALTLGVTTGLLGGETAATWIGWIGTLFIRLLRMIIIPLIFASIVSGVAAAGGGRALARLFSKTFGYFVLTTLIAIATGLIAVNLIRPGVGASFEGVTAGAIPELETPRSIIELLIAIVPENFIAAAGAGDMLALIFFSIVLGMSITALPETPRQRLVDLFDDGFQVMMRLTQGVMVFLPLGVFALITRLVGESGLESFRALGLYVATVALGLSFHLFVTLPLTLIVLGRINPRVHFANMFDAVSMAFSTSSSAATLPLTISNVEHKVGVSNRISSFVLPMGATINMNGTALFECAGVLFIAQALGVDLSIGQQLLVVFTALLAAIGTAAVPSASLVTIFIILEALNLTGPEVEVIIGAILAIDRPLDMYRTAINVMSDSCGAAIIARSEGETNVDVVAH